MGFLLSFILLRWSNSQGSTPVTRVIDWTSRDRSRIDGFIILVECGVVIHHVKLKARSQLATCGDRVNRDGSGHTRAC
jgi:hypothetical protein